MCLIFNGFYLGDIKICFGDITNFGYCSQKLNNPTDHNKHASKLVHFLQAICAKSDGDPCCDWVGEDGSGHFVKMVHNGIEYGDMQLICEAYNLMKDTLGMTHDGEFNFWP